MQMLKGSCLFRQLLSSAPSLLFHPVDVGGVAAETAAVLEEYAVVAMIPIFSPLFLHIYMQYVIHRSTRP